MGKCGVIGSGGKTFKSKQFWKICSNFNLFPASLKFFAQILVFRKGLPFEKTAQLNKFAPDFYSDKFLRPFQPSFRIQNKGILLKTRFILEG